MLTVRLVARVGRWFPEETMGAGLDVEAFAEEGGPLRNPGPLIRVPEGTLIHVSIRNALAGETLVVHGLLSRPAAADDTIQVAPGTTRAVRFAAVAAPADTQLVRLIAQQRPHVYGAAPGMGYALQAEGPVAPDSITTPGAPIILTRGQLARITVVNHLPDTTAVHWHGMELESYYDGIAGMSGTPGRLAPAIAPGDSFVAEMRPPRAGTFIYHTHIRDIRQLSLGMYRALLVLLPGERYDPATDHVVFLSLGGIGDSAQLLVNGAADPRPIVLRAGIPQRLRFIAMLPAGKGEVRLVRGSSLERWRPVGKDGAEVPAPRAVVGPARVAISVGETYDFAYTPPAPGMLRLEIWTPDGAARLRVVPVRVE
jgi:FtsP/CotA-like multicopper oxidase with cupredoxin domain